MSDLTPSEAEEALADGDEEDVAEALEVEREAAEAAPEEAAVSSDTVADLVEEEAELEAVVEEAVIEEIIEEIVEEAVLEAIEEAVVEEIAEEIVEEIALETAASEPDLVLDATDSQDAADEDDELGGWVKDEEEEPLPVESPYDRPGRWYVVHTYSGYENKVRSNMGNVVASRGIEDRVFEVVIPMEDVDEFKGGKKVTVQKKVFPG
jgi:transcriptional antiterminator NusG